MLTTRVICPECGHRFSTSTERSRARCPECDEIFYLPDDDEAIQERPRHVYRSDDDQRRRPVRDDDRARDDDDRDRDDDDEVPRRKKKKRKKKKNTWVAPLILGVIGVAAVGAVVAVVVMLVGKMGSGGGNAAGHEYTSEQGGYKITFPRAPLEKTEQAMGIGIKMVYVEDRNGVFVAGYSDMPIPANEPWAKVQDRLQGSQMGMLQNTGGHPTKTNIHKGPPPRIEFEGTVTRPMQGKVRAKVYLQGKRLYQVFVMGTEAYVDSRDATRFLDSFEITKK
jgi:hypothetical protein